MKLTTPFSSIRDALKNNPIEKISCSIDDIQVPIKECGFLPEADEEVPNIDFWDTECEGHSTNSHCKIYDN